LFGRPTESFERALRRSTFGHELCLTGLGLLGVPGALVNQP